MIYIYSFLLSITLSQSQTLPGLYKYWNVVNGYDLLINADNTFKLTETGNAIPQSNWNGTWNLKNDTLILNFTNPINGVNQRKHIVESEYLIRGNIDAKADFLGTGLYSAPNYFYKIEGYYKNGKIKLKGKWESYSTVLGPSNKIGKWIFYNEDGSIKKIVEY